MLDIAPSEFLLVAFIALVVIGPKDLPKAMRVIGYWLGRARAVGRQFRSGFDEMVREAELAEMEKKWKAENERIMREHSASSADPVSSTDPAPTHAPADEPAPAMVEQPQMIENPHVVPSDTSADRSGDSALASAATPDGHGAVVDSDATSNATSNRAAS